MGGWSELVSGCDVGMSKVGVNTGHMFPEREVFGCGDGFRICGSFYLQF